MIEALDKRNKLIKLVDQSEAGWKTVDECMALDYDENSEDERKIRRAEQRALKKRDSKKNKYQNQNRVRPVSTDASSVFANHGQRLPTFRPFRPYGLAQRQQSNKSVVFRDSVVTGVASPAGIQPIHPKTRTTE